jgi:hypothetical protein
MNLSDTAYRVITDSALSGLELYYLRPGSRAYRRNYTSTRRSVWSPGKDIRHALLTQKALRELKEEGFSNGASKNLTKLLRLAGADDDVMAFEVEGFDRRLKGAKMDDVKKALREIGFDFYKNIAASGNDGFDDAERYFMKAVNLAVGARHENYQSAVKGKSIYKYAAKEWPFSREGWPSEISVGSFLSGASTILHGTIENPRDTAILIRHSGDEVCVYCCDRSWFKEKHPVTLPEVL